MLSNNMKTLNFGTNKNSEERVGARGELAGDELTSRMLPHLNIMTQIMALVIAI